MSIKAMTNNKIKAKGTIAQDFKRNEENLKSCE